MGPGDEGRRTAAYSHADDAPDTEAHLIAARDRWKGKHDIIEVFGGYLAVPDGTQIVQSTTIGGLNGKLERMEHVPDPDMTKAYSMEGRRAGKLLDERHLDAFPAEAHCSCGEMLRRETVTERWEHTGRMPGEAG